jgi:DNA-directed RNA polymerase specialized sigma24 family protein
VTGGIPADRATQTFLDQRELLFAMVYNLLGTVADTEDVLQETWLAWSARSGPRPPSRSATRAPTWSGSRSTRP